MLAKFCEWVVGPPPLIPQKEWISEDEWDKLRLELKKFNARVKTITGRIERDAAQCATFRTLYSSETLPPGWFSYTFRPTSGSSSSGSGIPPDPTKSPLVSYPKGWVMPADPTVTGWHWLSNMGNTPRPWRWDASIQVWAGQVANYDPAHMGHHNWTYVGPCPAPAPKPTL